MASEEQHVAVRLDKWLWAARFYKTRALALEAVNGGKISLNGERAKPAKILKLGDELLIRQPPYERHIIVLGVSHQRGPATVAQALYEETPESMTKRLALTEQIRAQPEPQFKGRPTKKARRQIHRFTNE
jgi:ribosome-associated heat shock protein Hsp15